MSYTIHSFGQCPTPLAWYTSALGLPHGSSPARFIYLPGMRLSLFEVPSPAPAPPPPRITTSVQQCPPTLQSYRIGVATHAGSENTFTVPKSLPDLSARPRRACLGGRCRALPRALKSTQRQSTRARNVRATCGMREDTCYCCVAYAGHTACDMQRTYELSA